MAKGATVNKLSVTVRTKSGKGASRQARRGDGHSEQRHRGTVTTMIGALRHDGISTLMATEGATTGQVFSSFVKFFLVPTLPRGDVVVLDNLAAHESCAAREAIHAAGAR